MDVRFPETCTVALIANGAIDHFPLIIDLIQHYDRIVAVDGGLANCHQMKIIPDLMIGDFDSAPNELLAFYSDTPKQTFPVEKDETDLELAVRTIDAMGVKKIGIFGATGKRVDHTLNNLNLLFNYPKKAIIETETETVFAIFGSKQIECLPGQTISLLPLNGPAYGVSSKGLKWEIDGAVVDQSFRSVSNICLGQTVEINIEQGALLCCLNRAQCVNLQ